MAQRPDLARDALWMKSTTVSEPCEYVVKSVMQPIEIIKCQEPTSDNPTATGDECGK
jgi:hypothetical protein